MKKRVLLSSMLLTSALTSPSLMAAETLTEALTTGKVSLDMNLRYEDVDQETTDGEALTLRSRLGYNTADFMGFSARLEVEDVSIVGGVDDYIAPPAGKVTPAGHSVIADAEVTEIDQSYLQYKQGWATAILGRQVIALDNQRFVGHVGWRQDRQTFDGFRTMLSPLEGLTVDLGYIDRRRRIFAENADIDSEDYLFNVGYVTPFGKVVVYDYELDNQDADIQYSNLGASFTGSVDIDAVKLLYAVEFATQERETKTTSFDTDYKKLELGTTVSGVTAKLGYEALGSDDGQMGFQTPLATLHAFNGWADIFLVTPNVGLVDTYVSVGGSVAGFGLLAVYHEFEADEASATVDDLGDELDLQVTRVFTENYSAGIKYAAYTAGDINQDTDKLWVWFTVKF